MKWILTILAAALILPAWMPVQPRVGKQQELTTGVETSLQKPQIPERISSLTDLQLLGPDLTLLQRLEWLVKWLGEEKRAPSLTTTGVGGGPIDSWYIQEQLIRGMAGGGDPRALRWLSKSRSVLDPDMRLAFRLALGIQGDKEQASVLARTLERNSQPRHRRLAAFGLGVIQAKSARTLLEDALSDTFSLTFNSTHKGKITVYPVRQQAEAALRKMDLPEGVEAAETKMQRFSSMISDYDSFVVENRGALERIAALANRSLARKP